MRNNLKQAVFLFFFTVLLFQCSSKNSDSASASQWVGLWTIEEDNGIAYQIEMKDDSTISESVFRQTGKWKLSEKDSSGNPQKFILTLGNSAPVSWNITSMNESEIHLNYYNDGNGKIVLRKLTEGGISPVTSFVRFSSLFHEPSRFAFPLFIPLSTEMMQQTLNEFIRNVADVRMTKLETKFGQWWLGVLESGDFSKGDMNKHLYAVTFNPKDQSTLQFIQLHQWDGFCDANYQVQPVKEQLSIVVNIWCEGGDSKKYFTIEKDGRIEETDGAMAFDENATSNQWAQLDSFRDFQGKWVPLFEGANGLERQQLCGAEGSIEITETDKGFFWRELGYQDVWEGIIQNFEVDGVSDGDRFDFQFILKSDGGTIAEIEVLHDEAHKGVMFFKGNPYTKQPDLFPVSNNKNDCP